MRLLQVYEVRLKSKNQEKLKQVLKTKLTFKDNEENFGNEKVKIIVL